MDNLTAADRERTMRAVRSRNTKPEMKVRRRAHALGLRFRIHRRDLPGTPDLIFPRSRTAVFVHGCFWHGHTGCRKSTLPATNPHFWRTKIDKNQDRDATTVQVLKALGWNVVVIWECETKNLAQIDAHLKPLVEFYRGPANRRTRD